MKQEKAKAKKIFKIVGNTFFFVFMGVMILLILLSVVSKKTNRPLLRYSTMWVLTDSMEPTFEANSYILVKTVDVSTLKKGDIIVFVSSASEIRGEYNTHRIEEVVEEGKEFITKGDNSVKADEDHVFAENIAYRYVCNLDVLTALGRVYSTEVGLLATISIILLLVAGYFVSAVNDIKKEARKKTKEEEINRLVAEEVQRLEQENKEKSQENL